MEYVRSVTDKCDSMGRPYQCVEKNTATGEEMYLRQDGDWDIPLDLSDEELLHIALLAHQNEISMNEYMVNIIKDMIENAKQS